MATRAWAMPPAILSVGCGDSAIAIAGDIVPAAISATIAIIKY